MNYQLLRLRMIFLNQENIFSILFQNSVMKLLLNEYFNMLKYKFRLKFRKYLRLKWNIKTKLYVGENLQE